MKLAFNSVRVLLTLATVCVIPLRTVSAVATTRIPSRAPTSFSSGQTKPRWGSTIFECNRSRKTASQKHVEHRVVPTPNKQYTYDKYQTRHHEHCSPHILHQGGGPALALLSPNRLVRLSAMAWLAAEVLGRLGFFDDPSMGLKEKYKVARFRVQQHWNRARAYGGILHQDTWTHPKENITRRLCGMQPKHQFAVGTGVGLIFSRFVLRLLPSLIKTSLFLYVISEVSNLLLDTVDESQDVRKSVNPRLVAVAEILENKLAGLRLAVRNSIRNPKSILLIVKAWCQGRTLDGEQVVPFDTMLGLGIGGIASFVL